MDCEPLKKVNVNVRRESERTLGERACVILLHIPASTAAPPCYLIDGQRGGLSTSSYIKKKTTTTQKT